MSEGNLGDEIGVAKVLREIHPNPMGVPAAHRVAALAVYLAPQHGAIIALFLNRASVVLPDLFFGFDGLEKPERVLYQVFDSPIVER